MLTVTKLARRCGLSRSTLLYYESIGLLRPAQRSVGNYRCYGEQDAERLRQICFYRDAGLKLEDVRAVLDDLGLLDDVSEDGGRWRYGALERGPFRFTGTGFRLQEDITPEDFPVPRRFTE